MEDVRAVLVNKDSGFVRHVVGVATYVRSFVYEQHASIRSGGKSLGHH